MSTIEDAGGYFCSVCGKPEPHNKCESLVSEVDIYWSVIFQTIQDTLEQEDTGGEQTCRFNKEARKRTLDILKKWRSQSFQRERLSRAYYSRTGY
ncbi:MAG: hypothetical protein ACYSW0_16045 [Planctomycetota bacterium]|jgi:hypothetical protein